MIINKIIPSVGYKLLLKRLETKLNEPTNQNLYKSPKLLEHRIRKLNYETLGTSV